MPVHFEFEGQHYEMPDGTTPDQAKSKIFKHLGREQAPAVEQKQEKRGVLNQGLRDALGGIEAAAGMVSALPSQVASGLEGLVRLPFQGLERATEEMRKTQDYRYHPRTESGKAAEEGLGFLFEKGVEASSPVLARMWKPFTDPNKVQATPESDLAAEVLLNLAGPEGLIAARAGMKPRVTSKVSGETVKGLEQFKKKSEETKSADSYQQALAELDKTMSEVQAPQFGQKGGKVARPEGAEGKRQRTVADQEKFDADMREIMQGLDEQTLESVTAKLDEQQPRSPYAQLETPPELARMNDRFVDTPRTLYADEFGQASPEQLSRVSSGADIRSADQLRDLYAQNEGTPRQPLDVGLTDYTPEKPFQYPQEAMVDVPTGTRQVARGPFVPKSQRGVLDLPEIMKGLEEMAAKMKARGEEPVSTLEANASGESSASMEAINRLRQEQAAGQERYKVKANGEVVPLTTADRVDAQAYPGEVILQRGVGKDEWTVLDNNKGNAFAAKAKLANIGNVKKQGGWFGGRKAFPDQSKLFDASEAAALSGATREEIYSKYGTWQGSDGKWRKEVPDPKKDSMVFDRLLAEAIPDEAFRNIIKGAENFRGNLFDTNSPMMEQRRRTGSSSKTFDVTKFLGEVLLDDDQLFKSFPDLRKVKVTFKFDNKNSTSRVDNGEQRGNTITLWGNDRGKMFSTLRHEIQHLIQDREGFSQGGKTKGVGEEAYQRYLELPGEIEARDVQDRLNMSAEQRANTIPQLADIAKRKGQGGAFTPFSSSKKETAVTEQFKTFENFYKSVPDELKDVAAEYWTANGGKLTGKDVTNPLANSKLGQYLEPMQANKSDLYEDNKVVVRQSPDITENAFRDVTMPEGASAKRWFNNPAVTYAVNLINGSKKRAEIATKRQLKDVETSIGNITGFFGGKKELHEALTSIARGESPTTARGAQLKETWDKISNGLYDSVNAAWKERQVAQGLSPTDLPKIDNYFPHTWEGPWGFRVVDPTTGETISIVRQKTRGDANKAKEYFQKTLGDNAEFQLSDISYNRAYERSKFQQDLGIVRESFLEMLDVLGTADPVIQRKQQQLDAALGRQAWDTLNFKQRTKRRIGVEGFLGDQPWKSVNENANDALEVMTNYVRDANTFVEAQKSSKELRKFSEDLAATHPNTVKYAEKYYEKTYGGLENKLKVIDDVLETTGKALGRSGSTFKDVAFSTKNFLTGIALGMGRPAYMLSNILQAPISVTPELVRMTAMDRNVGVGSALMSGVAQAAMLPINKRMVQKGKKGLFISDEAKKTFDYALKNDVIDPSIIETIDQVNPSIPKAVSDFVINKSIRTTEQLGRMWAFSSLTKALKDAGYKLDDAHQIARDLTDITMLDLDKHNRPRMYQYMGLAGEFAGNLQTFKHNFYTQLVYDMKKAKTSGADTAALLTKLGLVFASAGAMGIVGFREADEIINFMKQNLGVALNDREMIESRTPSQWLMEEVPMEVSMGPLSSFIGADVSQSFASPVVTPDSVTAAMYPLGKKAVEMAEGVGEIGKGIAQQDRMKVGAGASKILPDTPFVKGKVEEELLSKKLPSGNLAVENPRMGYGKVTERTPLQQQYRDVGLREINESMDRQLDYRLSQQERNINEAKQNIVNKIGEAMASYTINQRFNPEFKSKLGSLATKFVELGGDPEEFIRQAERIGMKRADTNIVTQEINKKLSNVRQQQKAQRRLESFQNSRTNR